MTHPPLLEGTNCAYWKARKKIFIQSIDDSIWDVVETEWTEPTKKEEDATIKIIKDMVKPRSEWSYAKKKSIKPIALNNIFVGIDEEKFKLISTCTLTEKAWDTLQVVHEGTSRIRYLNWRC